MRVTVAALLLASCSAGKFGASVADGGGASGTCSSIRCPPGNECRDGSCVRSDACAEIVCAEGLVCACGACVNPAVDQDADGFTAVADCDDCDADVRPGMTAPCSTACGSGLSTCAEGRWQPCSAPTDCICTQGERRLEPCGSCGTSARVCGEIGIWPEAPGPCEGEGDCESGAVQAEACPEQACGARSRVCGDDCTWSEFSACASQSECAPGAQESRPCGSCNGRKPFRCTDDCLWAPDGPCVEGQCDPDCVCNPGARRACGNCGEEICNGDCQSWGACQNQGCSPGTTDGSCGNCGTRTCGGNCQWECQNQGCSPGTTDGSCGNCGTRTCDGNCQWGCQNQSSCSPGEEGGRCSGCSLWTCGGDCQWGCPNPGSCWPGDPGGPCGNCGTAVCDGSCQWVCEEPPCCEGHAYSIDCGNCGYQNWICRNGAYGPDTDCLGDHAPIGARCDSNPDCCSGFCNGVCD